METAKNDEKAFANIPWCAKLLLDSSFVTCPTYSRIPTSVGGNTLATETFHTSRTIRAYLTQYRQSSTGQFPQIHELRSFLDLGDGLCGHPKTCHGGVMATLFDDIFGDLLNINIELMKRSGQVTDMIGALTASLNVQYIRPMPAPNVIVAKAKLESIDGRKIRMTGTLENGNGEMYARGEGIFIEMKGKKFQNQVDSSL